MNYINPFSYFLKSPTVKNFYAKRGINDMQGIVKNVANNPITGINSIQSGGVMIGLIGFLLFGIFNYSQIFFSKSLTDWTFENNTNDIIFLACIIIPSLLFNYFTLFKNNKYLEYFKVFEGFSDVKKNKYCWLSFIIILIISLFLIYSFKFLR